VRAEAAGPSPAAPHPPLSFLTPQQPAAASQASKEAHGDGGAATGPFAGARTLRKGGRAAVEWTSGGALCRRPDEENARWQNFPVPVVFNPPMRGPLPAQRKIAAVRWLAGEPQVGHRALFFRLGLGFFRIIRFESPSVFH
jgi:hypothetical protein